MSKSSFGKYFKRGKDYKKEHTYIMYHGTTMQAARKIKRAGFFPSSDGMLGKGVYVSRSFQKAACYPKGARGQERAVLELSVRVGKVKKIDRQGHPLQKSWHEAGFDTAWVPPKCGMVKSGRQENCIWDPSRIKVISIQRNTYGGKDEDSTDEEDEDDDDEDDDDDDEEEEDQMSDTYDNDTDDDHSAASHMSGEDSTNSSVADDDDDDNDDSEEADGEHSNECHEEQSDQSDEYQEQSDEFYEERRDYEEESDDDSY